MWKRRRVLIGVFAVPVVALLGLSGWTTLRVRSAQGALGDEIAAFGALDGVAVTRSGPCPATSLALSAADPDLLPRIVEELEAAGFDRLDRHTHMRERGDDLDADLVEVRAGDAGVTISASVFDHDLASCR